MACNNKIMTKQEVLSLFNGLQAVSEFPGAKWAYGVAKNLAILKPEIEALQKAYSASEEFMAYESQRLELAQKYSVKENGNPKTIKTGGGEEYIIADRDKFSQELKKLQKKHKRAIEERQKQIGDFNEILKEEVEIDFYMISPDYIPEEITPAQLSAIMPIISEKKGNA